MIETPRLILRPTRLSDLDRWSEMMADERAAQYIGGVQPKPVVWRMLMTQAGAWALTGLAMFSVIEKATGQWIGRVGAWHPLDWPGTEVGWALHPDAWGRGFAYEAAMASMAHTFDTLDCGDVVHCIHPDNLASQRLAARLGSVNRGPGQAPPPYHESRIDIWGQTRDEWRARAIAP